MLPLLFLVGVKKRGSGRVCEEWNWCWGVKKESHMSCYYTVSEWSCIIKIAGWWCNVIFGFNLTSLLGEGKNWVEKKSEGRECSWNMMHFSSGPDFMLVAWTRVWFVGSTCFGLNFASWDFLFKGVSGWRGSWDGVLCTFLLGRVCCRLGSYWRISLLLLFTIFFFEFGILNFKSEIRVLRSSH